MDLQNIQCTWHARLNLPCPYQCIQVRGFVSTGIISAIRLCILAHTKLFASSKTAQETWIIQDLHASVYMRRAQHSTRNWTFLLFSSTKATSKSAPTLLSCMCLHRDPSCRRVAVVVRRRVVAGIKRPKRTCFGTISMLLNERNIKYGFLVLFFDIVSIGHTWFSLWG